MPDMTLVALHRQKIAAMFLKEEKIWYKIAY